MRIKRMVKLCSDNAIGKKPTIISTSQNVIRLLLIALSTYRLITLLTYQPINYLYGGGRPGQFLSWGAGARQLALGNAAVGISNDASSLYYNSAGLGFVGQKEVTSFNALLWEDTSFNYLAYVHPMLDKGALGFEIIRLFSGDAVRTDENNTPVGSFSNQQLAFGVGYGKNVLKNLSVGVLGRFYNSTLDTAYNNNMTLNAGVSMQVSDIFTLGANFQNIFSVTLGDTSDELPLVFKLGGGYKIFGDRLMFSIDIGRNTGQSRFLDFYSVGLESRLNRYFSLRFGRNPREITGGIGLSFKNFNLDYAMAMHYLGLLHSASFNFRFGLTTKEMKEALSKPADAEPPETEVVVVITPETEQLFYENYQGAIDMYRRGIFTIALDRFKNASNIDPTDTAVQLYVERLNVIVPVVPQNMATDRISELMRRGIVNFVEGHGQNAVKILAYAHSLEPDNFTLTRLLGTVEEKTGYRADRSRPTSGLTIVDRKHHESLVAFRRRDFAETIRICEEILILEPNDVLALKRLGSAFFALGEKDKAKTMWEKSIEIEPDERIAELIRRIR